MPAVLMGVTSCRAGMEVPFVPGCHLPLHLSASPPLPPCPHGVQAGLAEVEKALAATGVDTAALSAGTSAAAGAATSAAKQAASFIGSSDPVKLLEDAGALTALYFLLPPLFKAVLESARGYAGGWGARGAGG